MRWKFWFEYALLLIAVICIAWTGYAYYLTFGSEPIGDQEQWSRFGDYFGGVTNPLIGLITVVLVVLTLRTTRQEADMTRRQMADQIELLKRQDILRDMQKRLEGILAEWNREMEQPVHPALRPTPISQMLAGQPTAAPTVRAVLEDRGIYSALIKASQAYGKENKQQRYVAPHWKTSFAHLMPLLSEIDAYCVEYERQAGTSGLANFYRARVKTAVLALGMAGIMMDSVHERLTDFR